VIIGSALSIDHPCQIPGLFDQPAPRRAAEIAVVTAASFSARAAGPC
jgi:hypothetical protein